MAELIGIIIVLILAVLALKLSHLAKAPVTDSLIVSRPILSENELEFFHRLQRALPTYHVFPQVAANALLKVASDVPKQQTHATRNKRLSAKLALKRSKSRFLPVAQDRQLTEQGGTPHLIQ